MREINLENYNKNKKERKLKMLEIRDQLKQEKRKRSGRKNRDPNKRILLYRLALQARQRKFEKISNREYKLLDQKINLEV